MEKTQEIKDSTEEQSIEQDQSDDCKVHNVINSKLPKRWFKYLRLSKSQKRLYKKVLNENKTKVDKLKTTFDKNNIFEVEHFDFWYNNHQKHALKEINMKIKRNKVTALIGPSGCGKSTFIRCLNRMNDQIPNTSSEGYIYFDNGTNLKSKKISTLELTTRVGMIFQKPSPFPMSIYENVAYGPKAHGINDKKMIDKIVQEALKSAALWDEVKDNLFDLGTSLSGGQQQRLCIARAIALKPETLLMDEPTSGLDPIATSKIEVLINNLKKDFTIIIVTHSMAQAQRVSDETAFFYQGRVIEMDTTKNIFTSPQNKKTREYISGKIG
ncbi:MAG: phosphate ABC transporter ATP-binding protein PstB [Mycoplasmataceae bacterium]|nr:phosphate ABC transporter ATP-binding protein PstB [Mycoplasmataceae bacterium]